MEPKTYNPTITEEIEFEINNEIDYKDVELTGEVSYGNTGIGGYEYCGSKETDIRMAFEVDYIYWDISIYSQVENKIIDEHIDKHTCRIEDKLIDQIRGNLEPEYDE